MRTRRWIAATVVTVLVAGCARQAAEQALANAEQAVAPLREQAAKVMPDGLAPLDEALAAGRRALEAKDYAAASAAVAEVPARAEQLGRELEERKSKLTSDWTVLQGAMAANLDSVRVRLERFGPGARLPAGVSRAALPRARAVLDSATQAWPGIEAEFAGGNLATAMARAMALRVAVSEAMTAVGLPADDRAWGNLQLRPAP